MAKKQKRFVISLYYLGESCRLVISILIISFFHYSNQIFKKSLQELIEIGVAKLLLKNCKKPCLMVHGSLSILKLSDS